MTYIIFSSFLGLLALALAVVPVTAILRHEARAGSAAPALVRPSITPSDQEELSVAA